MAGRKDLTIMLNLLELAILITAPGLQAPAPKIGPDLSMAARVSVLEVVDERAFVLGKTPNQRIVLKLDNGRQLILRSEGQVPCPPVYDAFDHMFSVAFDSTVKGIGATGDELWCHDLDFYYNPSSLLASNGVVVYDNGTDHLAMADFDNWASISAKSQRIVAREGRTGRLLWDRPWLDVGSPCLIARHNVIYTVRTPLPVRRGDDLSPLHGHFDERNLMTCKLIRTWAIPRWTVSRRRAGLRAITLTDWLRRPSNKWYAVAGHSGIVFKILGAVWPSLAGKTRQSWRCKCELVISRNHELGVNWRVPGLFNRLTLVKSEVSPQ